MSPLTVFLMASQEQRGPQTYGFYSPGFSNKESLTEALFRNRGCVFSSVFCLHGESCSWPRIPWTCKGCNIGKKTHTFLASDLLTPTFAYPLQSSWQQSRSLHLRESIPLLPSSVFMSATSKVTSRDSTEISQCLYLLLSPAFLKNVSPWSRRAVPCFAKHHLTVCW